MGLFGTRKEDHEKREAEKNIRRDDNGKPIVCDCPDGQSGPCDGCGWCRS